MVLFVEDVSDSARLGGDLGRRRPEYSNKVESGERSKLEADNWTPNLLELIVLLGGEPLKVSELVAAVEASICDEALDLTQPLEIVSFSVEDLVLVLVLVLIFFFPFSSLKTRRESK